MRSPTIGNRLSANDNPLWLAIETSGRAGSVALARGTLAEEMLVAEDLPAQRRHNVELFPVMARLFADLHLSPQGLTHIAVSAGPGSFTALRIGIVAARTLAQATGARLISVPTFEALAITAAGRLKPPPPHILTIANAKRGHVFGEVWEAKGGRAAIHPDGGGRGPAHAVRYWSLIPLGEYDLAELLTRAPRPLVAAGDTCLQHLDQLKEAGVTVPEPLIERPTASVVLQAAALQVQELGEAAFCDLHRLEPIYVRLAEAEEKWRAAHGTRPTAERHG